MKYSSTVLVVHTASRIQTTMNVVGHLAVSWALITLDFIQLNAAVTSNNIHDLRQYLACDLIKLI